MHNIPSKARFDTANVHQFLGPFKAGSIGVFPRDRTAPYVAQMFRYGGVSKTGIFPNQFRYAVGMNAQEGLSDSQVIGVSRGARADNYVVVTNVTNQNAGANFTFYANDGSTQTFSRSFFPQQQRHIHANEYLPENQSGILLIEPTRGSFIAESNSYYYNQINGTVLDANLLQGYQLTGNTVYASHNFFLADVNWIRMFNVSDSAITANINVIGHESPSSEVRLEANTGRDIPIFWFANFWTNYH